MAEKVSEIIVQFHLPPHVMFSLGPCEELTSNLLALCLTPDEGIHLRFEAKVPDQGMCLQPVDMEFHYETAFRDQTIPEAYERLLQDVMEGDSRLFIRTDQIEEAWRVVDPLLARWQELGAAGLEPYGVGSWGPAAADEMLRRDGREWLRGCGAHPMVAVG